MRFNVSAWSIRRPIPAVVAFAVLTILGLDQLPGDAGHPLSQHRHSDRPGPHHPVGRGAERTRIAGDEEGRGRRLQPQRRLAHHLDRHRRLVVDHGAVQRRLGRHRPRAQRREGRDRQDPRRPAAHHRRADRQPRRHRRPADRHLRGFRARHVGRAAVLVHRRHGGPRPAERPRRRRGEALRRRRPGDPRLAQSGEAARARRDRRGGQRAGPRRQRRSRRRTRRSRRSGAGDPHARRRA